MADHDKGFLDKAYDLQHGDGTKAFYRDWAATYEAETLANGYITPQRCAEALASLIAENSRSAPLLDLGCGTGLSGEAFRKQGFTCVDGTDFSEEMLSFARSKDGVYRKLIPGDLNNPLPGAPQEYAHIAAVGVFSPGHAPPEMITNVIEKLPAGGFFVFSLNDHALEIPGYQKQIEMLTGGGKAIEVFREYGEHLPKRAIKAVVSVLRKT